MDGSLVRDLETAILRSLKRRGATMANLIDIARFDGWTEAWARESLQVEAIRQMLDWVYCDESKFPAP
jgi:hypothetical protein